MYLLLYHAKRNLQDKSSAVNNAEKLTHDVCSFRERKSADVAFIAHVFGLFFFLFIKAAVLTFPLSHFPCDFIERHYIHISKLYDALRTFIPVFHNIQLSGNRN